MSGGFTFGGGAGFPSSGFGASTAQSTQPGSLFGTSLGTASAQSSASSGFSVGNTGGFGGNASLTFGGGNLSFGGGANTLSSATAATTTATTGFGGGTGFNFGTTPAAGTTAPLGGAVSSGGLSLGLPAMTANKAPGLGGSFMGLPTTANVTSTAAAPTGGFTTSFGGGLSGGLSGGFLSSAPTNTTSQFSLGGLGGGGGGITTGQSDGLKLGGSASASVGMASAASSTASFAGSGFKLGGITTATAAATTTASSTLLGGLLMGTKPAATATTTATSAFSFGTTATSGIASSAPTGITLGGQSLSSAVPATTTSAALPSLGFNLSSASAAAATTAAATTSGLSLTFGGASAANTAAPAASTATSSACVPTSTMPSMNYRQLEEAINKWTQELEEQEAVFLEQATQVNAWDRLLVENGEMITQLNQDMEKVKADQQRLDQELDFIIGQQCELEDMLKPLEQALEQLPPITYQQHADLEREHTYKLAENIDSQLKRMASDLKEIVEHLNSGTNAQDSNDPLIQIAKILNAHVDSLHWIDQKTGVLQRRVEDVSRQASAQRKQQTYR